MADEKTIVTLEVSEGKRFAENGEVVGSYSRSIVFLPRAQGVVKPGQSVRVVLVDTGRVDRNSRTMHEGQPAPVEYSDSWKDNGDGTCSP